ncbi:MAG: PilZ domain-containing protein [Byssovorax sp.]
MSGANSKEDESKQSGPPSSAPPSSRPPDSGLGVGEAEAVSERRGDYRHLACFPAHLHTEAGVTRTALIRDLSVSGALLLTRAAYAVDDTIKLSLYLTEGAEPTLVEGKVVRSSRRTGELAHPWTRSVAVRFDRTVKELEPIAKELAEKQAALFAKKA